MTKVYDDDGTLLYHEPPYTEQEEWDFYQRFGIPPIAIAAAPVAERLAAAKQQPQAPSAQPKPEE